MLLLTIVCIDAFTNYVVIFKIVFSCVWFIYILSIVIKIKHQNIYQYCCKVLWFNYQKNLHQNKNKEYLVTINNDSITYLNKNYYVKQLIPIRIYSNVQEQLEQLSANPNLNSNLIIIGISTNDLMQDYLSKIKNVNLNNKVTNLMQTHAFEVNEINQTCFKKQYFVLYQQPTDLTWLNLLS
ncbi:hypothetical protein J6P04_00915 [bacterium]|nr:hypothetical protein [bacterium]